MKSVEYEEDNILYNLHSEASKRGRSVISLRASEVLDFSSQYGSNEAISYTAENIVGPPTIYPRVGDNAYSFQLRTYGEWWHILPSSLNNFIKLPCNTPAESQDFIEFRVEKKVVPLLIRIYEVYNPGAIVKLFCFCYDTERWVAFWNGPPQILPPNKSNCFSAEIKGVDFLTDYFRIEFHHKHLNYYCEIDGLILYGEDISIQYLTFYGLPLPGQNSKLAKSKPCNEICDSKNLPKENVPVSYFDILPDEVVHLILNYLDLQSLCKVSMVSRSFQKLCYDPVLYKYLNLRLYWHLVDMKALKSLQSRLSSLKKLNLSWCGGQGRITSSFFAEFLGTNCQFVTSLQLSNCQFVNNNSLKAIANTCTSLKVLELQSCCGKDLTHTGFKYIAQMKSVTYLDLYRTLIDKSSIISIIKSLKLEHLHLGSCTNIADINEVARNIGHYLKHTLNTLDLWRATDLTCLGMHEIAENCHSLVELDVGWCYHIDASCGCVKQLITHCPKLKKLFLAAIRSISSIELYAIANYCPDIEQLDILGTNEVNIASLTNLLQSCRKLKLLDVSYCDTAVKVNLPDLQTAFPKVEIKSTSPLNFVY